MFLNVLWLVHRNTKYTKIWNRNNCSSNLLGNVYIVVLEVRNEALLSRSSKVNGSAPDDSLIVRDTLSIFGLLFFLDSTLKYFPGGVMRVVMLFKAIFLSVQAQVSSDI